MQLKIDGRQQGGNGFPVRVSLSAVVSGEVEVEITAGEVFRLLDRVLEEPEVWLSVEQGLEVAERMTRAAVLQETADAGLADYRKRPLEYLLRINRLAVLAVELWDRVKGLEAVQAPGETPGNVRFFDPGAVPERREWSPHLDEVRLARLKRAMSHHPHARAEAQSSLRLQKTGSGSILAKGVDLRK